MNCEKCKVKLRKREYYVESVGPYCLSCAKFIRYTKKVTGNMEVKTITTVRPFRRENEF